MPCLYADRLVSSCSARTSSFCERTSASSEWTKERCACSPARALGHVPPPPLTATSPCAAPCQVNMLAREYCDAAGIKLKPIILSHHMLYGLSKGQAKMSKSNKESAIFMEDTVEDVTRKITNAYAPPPSVVP